MRRSLVALALASAFVSALAQSTIGDRAQKQFDSARDASLDEWAWQASRDKPTTESDRAMQAVLNSVKQRDCAGAVRALNEGLAKAYPSVLLLAGSMYEEGVCLKPNWDRAAKLYQRAEAAGHAMAAARLASGYAAPVGGPDKAAALWWAIRAKTTLPQECRVDASLVNDADRFVGVLKGWPAGQLDACAYAAGVMATIQGDAEFPSLAASHGLQGTVRLAFVPEQGRIDITGETVEAVPLAGVVSGDAVRDGENRRVRGRFSAYLRELSDRALRRYTKPAGIAPTWRVEAEYVFKSAD